MRKTATPRRMLRCAAGTLLLLCLGAPIAGAQDYATNKAPLAFGPDQTIIDLNKIEWGRSNSKGFRRVLRSRCFAAISPTAAS